MEQDLIENNNENLGLKDYFKPEYINQDVSNSPEFKKWYKKAKEYIHNENLKRNNQKNFDVKKDYNILTIAYCNECKSYTICSIVMYSYCYSECQICKKTLCIGCSKELNHLNYSYINSSTCLKGYLKAFYLRIIYRRALIERTNACFFIIHIILCLFLTPLYLGFLSNLIGLITHPNKNTKYDSDCKMLFATLFSLLRGLLMFPYIILFFPFMIIVLLPGIFSFRYYLYIYNAYLTALLAGPYSLANVGDN